MKKIIILLSLIALLVPSLVSADSGSEGLKVGSKKVLSQNAVATLVSKDQDKNTETWKVKIGKLEYLPDLSTKIVPRWTYSFKDKGYTAGPNLFEAHTRGETVYVTYAGSKYTWSPRITIDGKMVQAKDSEGSDLDKDPINENYSRNTISWTYDTVERRVRLIEGLIMEFYVIEEMPAGTIVIDPSVEKDFDFTWDRELYAYDAENRSVPLTIDKNGKVTLTTETIEQFTLPITIDPDLSFVTSSADGYVSKTAETWSGTRNSTTGTFSSTTGLSITSSARYVEQTYGPEYNIRRGFLYFDTSSISESSTISAVSLFLYTYDREGNYSLCVQKGTQGDSLSTSSYDDFSGTYYDTATPSTGSYIEFELNSTGISELDTTGTTKYCIRNLQRDYNDSNPSESTPYYSKVYFYSYEKGTGYWPYLEVTYTSSAAPTCTTLSAINVANTTATLRGYLDSDGGEPNTWQFQYYTGAGDWTDNETGFEGSASTGATVTKDIVSLTADTTYNFRVQFKNTTGTTSGDSVELTTENNVGNPSALLANPSAFDTVSLKWVKGTGATNSLLRAKKGGYPTDETDGEQLYLGPLATYSHEDLSSGETWYYRVWGEDSDDYSASYSEDLATTLLGGTTGSSTIDAPVLPSSWFTASSAAKMSNLPVYDLFNDIADQIDIPRGSFWLVLGLLLSVIGGALFFIITGHILFALIGVGLVMLGCVLAGILPGYIIFAFLVMGGGLAYSQKGV